MFKNLFAALFGREKKTMPEPARAETRLPDHPVIRQAPRTEQRLQTQRAKPKLPEPRQEELRMLQPQVTKKAATSSSPSRAAGHDDSLSNPANPLSPLNPLHPLHSSGYEPASPSRCDDSHRSSWGSSSDYSSSCSSSSSDSGSSCSSSCD